MVGGDILAGEGGGGGREMYKVLGGQRRRLMPRPAGGAFDEDFAGAIDDDFGQVFVCEIGRQRLEIAFEDETCAAAIAGSSGSHGLVTMTWSAMDAGGGLNIWVRVSMRRSR